MATNFPKTVPEAFAKHDDLKTSYYYGWRHGHGCAACNVPSIGDRIDRCIDWVGCGDTVDADNIREYHELLAFAGADNSRDFSPFEFTAHWLNEHDSEYSEREEGDDAVSAEACWEAFEEGITDAIRAELAEFSNSDYGIEEDDADQDQEDEEPDQDDDWLDDEENADTLADWRQEVANGDTSRSYEDWLEVRREQNADRRAYLARKDAAK